MQRIVFLRPVVASLAMLALLVPSTGWASVDDDEQLGLLDGERMDGRVDLDPLRDMGPAPATDEVTLKDGGFVRGEVVQEVPGESVTIRDPRGVSRTFDWSRVARVERNKYPEGPPPLPERKPLPNAGPGSGSPAPGASGGGASPGTSEWPTDPRLARAGDPWIHITVTNNRPVELVHVVGNDFKLVGDTVIQTVYYEQICDDPCDAVIPGAGGRKFYIANRNRPNRIFENSAEFIIPASAKNVELRVRAGRKGLGSWGTLTTTLGVSAFVGGIVWLALGASSANEDTPLAPMVAGSTSLMLGGLGMTVGGIFMVRFGRNKVEMFTE